MKMIDYNLLKGKITAMQSTEPEYAFNFLNNAQNPSTEWECIEDMLDNMEVYEAEPVKRGKWEEHHATYIKQLDAWFVQAKCSCCGRYSDKMDNYSQYLDLEYCSHCSADMREKEGE